MKVYFVMGPTGAGKSTYIKNYLPEDSIIIDIHDFQKEVIRNKSIISMDDLLLAEKNCVNTLIKLIKDNKEKDTTIVLEHTMCFNTRKENYLRVAKSAGADYIEGICIIPNEKEYIKRLNKKLPDMSPIEKLEYTTSFKNFETPSGRRFNKLTFVY